MTKRIKAMSELYDIIRIDHFRGFDSYYAIPAKKIRLQRTENGNRVREWICLTSWRRNLASFRSLWKILDFFDRFRPQTFLKDSGFPGMKVIQFAFDSREGSDYLPHTYTSHCVVYTGTHDNDTVMGWMKTAPKASVKFANRVPESDRGGRI